MPKIWDELHLKRTFNFIIFKSDSHTTWSKKTLKVLNFLVFDIFLKKKTVPCMDHAYSCMASMEFT